VAPAAGVTVVVPFGPVPDWRFGAGVGRPAAARMRRFVTALGREATRRARDFCRTTFTTVYLAGGPTSLTLEQLYQILQALYDNLIIAPEEQTLEVLPGTVDEGRAKVLKESGFDHLNLRLADGLLPEPDLRILSRAGFNSIGLELSFGTDPSGWKKRLDRLAGLNPARIHFHLPPATATRVAVLQALRLAREKLTGTWREYLLHHYCRPGHESRHLISLWHDSVQLGLGPAAVTRTAEGVRRNPARLGDYVAAAESDRLPRAASSFPAPVADMVRMEGTPARRLNPATARSLLDNGLVTRKGDRLLLTDQGALALDRVVKALA